MAVEAYLPTILTVVTTAAIDSINPCAIGVLILMVSVILGSGKSIKHMLLLGGLYVFSVFVVYLLAGFGLLFFLASLPLALTEYLSISVGIIIILAGLLEIKDFFWYGRGFSLAIPVYFSKKLHGLASKTTIPGVILLGAFVSAVELPCTGAPYLAILAILGQGKHRNQNFWNQPVFGKWEFNGWSVRQDFNSPGYSESCDLPEIFEANDKLEHDRDAKYITIGKGFTS